MTYQEKLVENFIKGLKSIAHCKMRDTKGVETYEYEIKGIKHQESFTDACIIDCDKKTMESWLKINAMFNEEYKKDKTIGELLDKELKKLDGENLLKNLQ